MGYLTNTRTNGWVRIDPTDPDAGLDLYVSGKRALSFGDSQVLDSITEGARPSALLFGQGTSASPVTTTADGKNISFYFSTSNTGGATDGIYVRQYFTGAGGGGEALRAFGTVSDVQGSTARGAHISLSFGTSGTVSGLAAALETTLHMPSTAGMAGTNYSIKAAINADAATSDPVGATTIGFIGIVAQGNATGLADLDTDGVLMDVQGLTGATGVTNLLSTTSLAELPTGTVGLRCKVGSTLYYVPLVVSTEWN